MNGCKGTPPDSFVIQRTTELMEPGEYIFRLFLYDNDGNSRCAYAGDVTYAQVITFKLKLTQPAATN